MSLQSVLLLTFLGFARDPLQVAGPAPSEPVRRALLVGVENYPEGSGWKALAGPRTDVRALEEMLVGPAGFRAEDVTILLDEQATKASILDALSDLIDAAGEGDLLLFYFSGHGSRVPDQDGDEPDGWDETLVPFDGLSAAGEADLRDDELREWIARANERTDQVVLLFDCCSSGTAVRGDEDVARRFLDPLERGLAGVRPGAVSRSEGRSGYFPPELSYVALSACRAAESAYEYRIPMEDGEDGEVRVQGLFTYCLVQEWAGLPPDASYGEFLRRVRQRVRGVREDQTPVHEGPLAQRAVFGGALRDVPLSFELRPGRGRDLILSGGVVHGLLPGAVLDVFEDGTIRTQGIPRVGEVRLGRVGPTLSLAQWQGAAAPRPATYRAFPSEPSPEEPRVPVALSVATRGAGEAIDRLALALEATGLLRLSTLSEAAFRIELTAGPETEAVWSLFDDRGTPLPASARADSEIETERLAAVLAQIARSKLLSERLGDLQDGRIKCGIEFVLVSDESRSLGPPPTDEEGRPVLREGDNCALRLHNRSAFALFASLLVCSPDGGVSVLPITETPDDAIPPGHRATTPVFQVEIPEETRDYYRSGPERYIVVLTSSFHDLVGLEQDSVFLIGSTRGGEESEGLTLPLEAVQTRLFEVSTGGS